MRGVAEALPLGDGVVDAALASLTVHHWSDVAAGVAEMRRVARHRIVVLTWDQGVFESFWLIRKYLPAAGAVARRQARTTAAISDLLPQAQVLTVPVPHDCVDGFGAAFWRRPQAYLDPAVRAGISMLALADPVVLERGLSALRADIDPGRWDDEHADLLTATELDAGYRLVVAELRVVTGALRHPGRDWG